MRSNEFILEIFSPNKAAKLTWTHGGKLATALVAPRKKLGITFSNKGKTTGIEFNINGKFDITGEGNPSVIFATVIEAIKEFVTIDPSKNSLYFTATEKSRARMYDTLAKRVSRQLGWHVVPYDDMMADNKYDPAKTGDYIFAIEKGAAPEHRQSAQSPEHGDFMTIFYVYAVEFPELPAIKIKAKVTYEAETWVKDNVPEYKDTDKDGIFASKSPPPGRKIIDMGTVPEKPKPIPQDPNSLGAMLRAKLNTPRQ